MDFLKRRLLVILIKVGVKEVCLENERRGIGGSLDIFLRKFCCEGEKKMG